jgi:hypothetical protein
MIELPPNQLDAIYDRWLSPREPAPWGPKKYQRQYRSSAVSKQFEDFLWANGMTVKQRNGNRYLVFSGEPEDLAYFLMQHGS